ncbi:hypothetical protein [Sneathiella sp. HT1-7]|uniref:hypothetical protein n=1 Tax=Sneathiella sp. HT1-7 TaxID=2887192 RepID=UPI001D13EC22|nr:hypothetical protein [Sneathiella sp. HT1-7]MCC3306048.1 hypothetical protein [Sneathiella sp. HT1-7]
MEVMGWIVVLIIGGYFFFKKNTERGQRFVRAYAFLVQIDDGGNVDEANRIAANVFSKHSNPDSDSRTIGLARSYAAAVHGGKQLSVITEAQAKGFKG